MNDVIQKLLDLFDFRLWSENLKFLVLVDSQENSKSFTDNFKGGLQKTLILSLLVVACNVTYRSGRNAADVTGLIMPIAVAGFSLYILTFHVIQIFLRDNDRARYYSNLLIMHLVLTLSVILVVNVVGVSNEFYEKGLKQLENPGLADIVANKLYSAFFVATVASGIISVTTLLNTRMQALLDGGLTSELKAVARLICLFSYSSVVAAGFLLAKLPTAT
jgi:hypothetical protein